MFYVTEKIGRGSKCREKRVAFIVEKWSLTITAWCSEDVFIAEIFILNVQKESHEHTSDTKFF